MRASATLAPNSAHPLRYPLTDGKWTNWRATVHVTCSWKLNKRLLTSAFILLYSSKVARSCMCRALTYRCLQKGIKKSREEDEPATTIWVPSPVKRRWLPYNQYSIGMCESLPFILHLVICTHIFSVIMSPLSMHPFTPVVILCLVLSNKSLLHSYPVLGYDILSHNNCFLCFSIMS